MPVEIPRRYSPLIYCDPSELLWPVTINILLTVLEVSNSTITDNLLTCLSDRPLSILGTATRWICHVWIGHFCDTQRLHLSRTLKALNCVAFYKRLLTLLFPTSYLTARQQRPWHGSGRRCYFLKRCPIICYYIVYN